MNVKLDLAKLHTLRTGVASAAAAAVYREMEGVVRPDVLPRVPVDEGVLKGSVLTEKPVVDGDEVSCILGAGGAASEYALVQHENLEFRHTVGEAKYLTNALNATEPGRDARIARTIARELGL